MNSAISYHPHPPLNSELIPVLMTADVGPLHDTLRCKLTFIARRHTQHAERDMFHHFSPLSVCLSRPVCLSEGTYISSHY